jgi:hypothetical protein
MDKPNLIEFFKGSAIKEILNRNIDTCFVCLLGEKNGKSFVLKIKKKEDESYDEKQWQENLSQLKEFTLTFDNDVYTKYTLLNFLKSEVRKLFINQHNIELIFPADQKAIDKNRKKVFSLFLETFDFYQKVIQTQSKQGNSASNRQNLRNKKRCTVDLQYPL